GASAGWPERALAGPHYDALETRDPAERERSLFDALPLHLEQARVASPYLRRVLEGIASRHFPTPPALPALPLPRKSALPDPQRAPPPFGGLTATPPARLARIFMSPGPIFDPEGRAPDYWRAARGLYAAGFRPGHVALNCFSYHLTPAGSMLETGL